MDMKKQVFSVIMALCLCLGLLPTAALAAAAVADFPLVAGLCT